jgi:hypothetical protein
MRTGSVLKIISLAAVLAVAAGVPGAFAKHRYTRRPPDACLFHRRILISGTWCSYQCNPNGLGCLQQLCSGGQLYPALPCLRPFCVQSCG